MVVQTNIYLHELKFCQKLYKQKSYNHFCEAYFCQVGKLQPPLPGGEVDKKIFFCSKSKFLGGPNILAKFHWIQREWLPQVIDFRKNDPKYIFWTIFNSNKLSTTQQPIFWHHRKKYKQNIGQLMPKTRYG